PGNVGGPSDSDQSIASGRTMGDIAAGKGRAAKPFMTAAGAPAGAVWQSNRDDSEPAGLIEPTKPKRSARTKTVRRIPDYVDPQLTKSLDKPPTEPGWAHELKFDGYRMQLRAEGGGALLRTRKVLDWS